MQYTRGSIIYFEGDKDERIFIVQSGVVLLTSSDIESGEPVSEQVKSGEFFGVRAALGRFAREETATCLVPTSAIILTIQEFENVLSREKSLMMKTLRVFSNQLRNIHKRTESILNKVAEDSQSGMLAVAKSFYDEEQYRSACDIYEKFFARYPNADKKGEILKLYEKAKLYKTKLDAVARENPAEENVEIKDENANLSLKIFSLPTFERFEKFYEPGQVIISEYEPGDRFYLIQSGRVQLVKCVNDQKKNLDILKPGEFFGEMAILDNSPRSATCVAIGKVKCLEFNKENFELLITGNPQIALLLLKLFCKRIYDQKRRFRILAVKDLQAKIADVFLMLDEMNPVAPGADCRRRFDVTFADVAHWAALPVETVKDEIGRFSERRKIDVYDNYMIVDNINDLKRLYENRCNF